MRKKLLLSCLSVIALAVLGIGANADMFKPYERYEIPVETADIIVEEMEETDSGHEPTEETPDDKSSSVEPVNPKPEPTPVPDPKPVEKPSVPDYACPAGMDPNKPCNAIMDTSFYYATYSSQSEADNAGQYFLDDVVTIGDKEVTNYSVQPVYRNDGSVAYYGLNLWSYGSLIQ